MKEGETRILVRLEKRTYARDFRSRWSGSNCIGFLFPSRHALQHPAFSSFFLICIVYFGLFLSFFSFFYFLPGLVHASCFSLFFGVYNKRKNLGDYNPSTTFKPCMELFSTLKFSFAIRKVNEWLLLSSPLFFPAPAMPSHPCPTPALT